MYVSELEQPLLDAIIRMIRLLNTPDDIPALTPLIKEEIIYRLLQGEYGSRLKQLAIEGSSTQQVHYVIQYIMKRSEEHTSELQSRFDLVCRLLLEKKKQN